MDEIDKAQQREQEWLQDMHRHHARRISKQQQAAALDAALECDDCDAPIPRARRKAVPGVRRCIHCQAAFEKEMR